MRKHFFTCPRCGGHSWGTGVKSGVETGFCVSVYQGRTCSFYWPRSEDATHIRPTLSQQSDEDTDIIGDEHQIDDLTAVMREVSNELRRVAETGDYKGVFVDPVVEKAAQAIKKLWEETKAYRAKSK